MAKKDKKLEKLKDELAWQNRHKKVGVAVRTSSAIQKNYIPKTWNDYRVWF